MSDTSDTPVKRALEDDHSIFDIGYALPRSRVREVRGEWSEDERRMIANAIVEHLRLCGSPRSQRGPAGQVIELGPTTPQVMVLEFLLAEMDQQDRNRLQSQGIDPTSLLDKPNLSDANECSTRAALLECTRRQAAAVMLT